MLPSVLTWAGWGCPPCCRPCPRGRGRGRARGGRGAPAAAPPPRLQQQRGSVMISAVND